MSEELFYEFLKKKNIEHNWGLDEFDFPEIFTLYYDLIAEQDLAYDDNAYQNERLLSKVVNYYLKKEKSTEEKAYKNAKFIETNVKKGTMMAPLDFAEASVSDLEQQILTDGLDELDNHSDIGEIEYTDINGSHHKL